MCATLKEKPNIVKDYNNGMSGIDRSDQMLSYHSALRKTIRWYKKVGVHLVEMMLTNAFYLHKKFGPRGDNNFGKLRLFRENIIENLVGPPRKSKRQRASRGRYHVLTPIPPTEKKQNASRRCVTCQKSGTRKETRYECTYCEEIPALCIHPCFRKFHEEKGVFQQDNSDSDEQ